MISKISIAFLCLVMGLVVRSTFGQQPEWVTIESSKGDFSVDIPADDWIVDIEGDVRTIYQAGFAHSVTINMRTVRSAKKEIRDQMRFFRQEDGYEYLEGGDFHVRRYSGKPMGDDSEVEKKTYIWLTFGSSKGYYSVSVTAPSATDNLYRQVLGSIRLDELPFVKTPSVFSDPKRLIGIESLTMDDRVLSAIRMPDSKQSAPESGTEEEYSTKDNAKYSRSLIILRKAKAMYTDNARRKRVSGKVHLLVTFRANGELGPIKLVRSLDKGLDKAAFEAARKMKFIPAQIDGKPVDTVRPVVYNFSVY